MMPRTARLDRWLAHPTKLMFISVAITLIVATKSPILGTTLSHVFGKTERTKLIRCKCSAALSVICSGRIVMPSSAVVYSWSEFDKIDKNLAKMKSVQSVQVFPAVSNKSKPIWKHCRSLCLYDDYKCVPVHLSHLSLHEFQNSNLSKRLLLDPIGELELMNCQPRPSMHRHRLVIDKCHFQGSRSW